MQYVIDHQQRAIHESRYMENRCHVHVDAASPEKTEVVDSRTYIERLEHQEAYIPCPYCHQVPLIID